MNILHILGVRSEEAGTVECIASLPSSFAKKDQSAIGQSADTISTRCKTELSVFDQDQAFGVASYCCASEEASMDQEDGVCSGGSDSGVPAMLLKAPKNATALVGDRVLLKVTYIGQPEPTVRWTRAVSFNVVFFNINNIRRFK